MFDILQLIRSIHESLQVPLAVVSVGVVLFRTLRNTFRYLSKDDRSESFDEEQIIQLQSRLDSLENQTNATSLSDDERKTIVDVFTDRLSAQETSKIYDELRKELNKDNAIEVIRRLYASSISRLRAEVEAQDRRSNVNLLIGIGMALFGIASLIFFIFQQGDQSINNKDALILNFIPHFVVRISLVILVEIFSYFFLRLYRTGMSEIKYFQNKLTNVEFRLFALEISYYSTNQSNIGKTIADFLHTERNFILKKGDRTIEIATEEAAVKSDERFSKLFDKIMGKLNAK